MHVAIVGMGALGRVYGVRLAANGAADVTFVVRSARATPRLSITRVDGDGTTLDLTAPGITTHIPDTADVAIVCVRVEQLDAALDEVLDAVRSIPIVVLTPLLPHDFDRLVKRHGTRLLAAMPGVVSYITTDGGCRYWLPKVAPTLIEQTTPESPVVTELVQALRAGGLPARVEPGVRETNPATTISFIPLAMGIDAAGTIDALLDDRALLRLSLDAVTEGLALASRVGTAPPWVGMLARFVGPMTLRIGIGLARSRSPEALRYVDDHFGRKLHPQNVVMARAIVALAREKGTASVALEKLSARLDAVPVA